MGARYITLYFPKAVEFRSFWGEKSELRRFHDGAINEAVVWDKEPEKAYQDKTTICHRVIQYLLQRLGSLSKEKEILIVE